MSVSQLPVQSYAAAVPLLRRPYKANQIRALVTSAPDNLNAPCRLGLFVTSETVIDRFNLICGENWDVSFQELAQTVTGSNEKPICYYKLRCTVTVFGTVRSDLGEGSADSAAMAEFLARAQAFKRAARWHGPGMCLYVAEEIIMYRLTGSDSKEPAKLRVPQKVRAEDTPHRRPYLVKENETHYRGEYAKWLTEEGEALFGDALDHLELAKQLGTRLENTASAFATPPDLPPSTPPAVAGRSQGHDSSPAVREPARPLELEPAPADAAAGTPLVASEGAPITDHPAPPDAITSVSKAGYSEAVAQALSNLARPEGQAAKLTDSQLQTVVNWATVLARLKVPEWMLMKAATHDANAAMTQERRQARFAKWIANKATHRGSGDEEADDAATAQASEEFGLAFAALRRAMSEHDYSNLPVARIAALATGGGPQTQIEWRSVPLATIGEITDLLDCAAALEWSDERLDKEAINAHNSNRQDTGAGRFSAFAYSLRDLAESQPVPTGTAS